VDDLAHHRLEFIVRFDPDQRFSGCQFFSPLIAATN
jgi:hypothetical protein